MAVVNRWINAEVQADKKGDSAAVSGNEVKCLQATFETVAGDSNLSILKIGRLPANAIPVKCEIVNDTLTNATDWDLGLYEEDGVTEADKDIFMDGEDINAGNAITSPVNGLKTGPAIDDIGKTLWDLLGKTIKDKPSGYVLAFTCVVIGTTAATVSIQFWYTVGN